jgi:hypothetical protein
MIGFFRKIRNGTYLSMIGGTLLSSGIGAYVNVVGSTDLPKGVWFLGIGALCLSISGIALFAAANQLDAILKPVHGAPTDMKPAELDAIWAASFKERGTTLTANFVVGVLLGILGAGLLSYRLTLI